MLETLAQAVINGLLIGGIYALVSIGVTLIFGVVKIVNFAQGEFVMIGMYLSFFLATQFGIDPVLSLVVTMPALFVVGVLIQHFLIRRVLGQNDMPQIFLTFALSLLMVNLSLMLFTANYRTVHTWYSDEALHFNGLYIPLAKLFAFGLAMVLSARLWVFLHATDLGKAMRAAAQNREVAMLMGINPNRVFCVALGVALALAGAAGSLLMPFYPAYPLVGQVFVLMAFVAVVLGTLGNITRRARREPDDGRCRIARHPVHRRRFRPHRRLPACFCSRSRSGRAGLPAAARDEAGVRGSAPLAACRACRRCCSCLPLARDERVHASISSSASCCSPSSASPGTSWAATPSSSRLGHAAYFGLGAYTSTILQIDFDISPWIGMLAGGVVAMLASLPIGWLCFRLRGPYFTIATIATAQVLMLLFLKFRDFAWGAEGTTIPNLGNAPLMMQFEAKAAYYYVALGLLAVGLAITFLVERSFIGYYLVAIGENEDAAEAIGVDAPRDQARHLYDQRLSHRSRRHLLHRSTSTSSTRRPPSTSTSRSRRRWSRSSAGSARCGAR